MAGRRLTPARPVTIGILALQGGFEAHERMLAAPGVTARRVRTPADLEGLDALVLPGGESTTMTLGIEREGLAEPLRRFARAARPILATCAGLILLDRRHLGVLDIVCARNAYGSQIKSFEAEFPVDGVDGGPFTGVFIRAPWIEEPPAGVAVIARFEGRPVAIIGGSVLGLTFHPELSGDPRLHELFVASVRAGASPAAVDGGQGRAAA